MRDDVVKLSTVKEMREMDRTAIEKYSIPEEILMENAGEAAYFVILKELGVGDRRFVVACGSGNNGGDGLVVARKLHSSGGHVIVYLLGKEGSYKGSAERNLRTLSTFPLEIKHLSSLDTFRDDVARADVIIDAVFGTGISRPLDGIYSQVIKVINGSQKTVVSLDIPSGINGDTGKTLGEAVSADYTITFGLPKLGNMLFPGFSHCGKLYVSHISFPHKLTHSQSLRVEINVPCVLPSRRAWGHKGDFGDALFISGAANYYGAPYLSAYSFLKAGGGYSRLAAPSSVTPHVAAGGCEIVFIPQTETQTGSIALSNKENLIEASEEVDFVVIGPGLSLHSETQTLVCELVEAIHKPIIIDGDGLTAIAGSPEILAARKDATVITPHMGEMARIAHLPIKELDLDKIDVVRRQSAELDTIVVLKGAHTIIGYPDGLILINTSGNSGMATAGAGDVLTGTIAAMHGLGLSLNDAVKTGVFMHGLAGDLCAQRKGQDGMTAGDILDSLPDTLIHYRENYRNIVASYHESLCMI